MKARVRGIEIEGTAAEISEVLFGNNLGVIENMNSPEPSCESDENITLEPVRTSDMSYTRHRGKRKSSKKRMAISKKGTILYKRMLGKPLKEWMLSQPGIENKPVEDVMKMIRKAGVAICVSNSKLKRSLWGAMWEIKKRNKVLPLA